MSGLAVIGKWPKDTGVTFAVRRGTFVVPKGVLERDDDDELARFFAQRIPPGAKIGRRDRQADGSVRILWRIIRVVEA